MYGERAVALLAAMKAVLEVRPTKKQLAGYAYSCRYMRLIPSTRREKTKEPDLGTYHHSTSVASKKIRTVVKAMFTDLLRIDDELKSMWVALLELYKC